MKNNKIQKAIGRTMLSWAGKRPLEKVEYYPAQLKESYGKNEKDFNRLYLGDNLQVLSHLLDEFKGKIDLIYIDPPFDSKADYVKKIKVRGQQIEGIQQSLIEEKQYSDIWKKDEYLQFMFERLLIMRELLSDTGSIYLHCDYHKGAYLRLIMDEIFGEENFLNEIIWNYKGTSNSDRSFAKKHDNILFYSKNKDKHIFNADDVRISYEEDDKFEKDKEGKYFQWWKKGKKYYPAQKLVNGSYELLGKYQYDVWNDIPSMATSHGFEILHYPTQKPEKLLERIIKASSNEGDLILDCFAGSGTTLAVAQKLNRKWIGCDINEVAIQTTTKRLLKIIKEQKKENGLLKEKKIIDSFKIFSVNNYDIFKNGIETKKLIMEKYGIEDLKRSFFDGKLGIDFVKILSIKRVLNKKDIEDILGGIERNINDFTIKKTTKGKEAIYNEKVRIFCSGLEYDVLDFIRKNNKTGIKIEIKDIQKDKNKLVFKEPTEAEIKIEKKEGNLIIKIEDYFSPVLMARLESENEKILKSDDKIKLKDFRQIIDSVAIDTNYNGKDFSPEIFDIPEKKSDVIKGIYEIKDFKKKIAIKIVDVLGDKYFGSFDV
jgi:site-specific DNA-methyltransferase (adenine-specific)/adenine-specific DNA-methyltransferase